jgi:cation/acetate symporter
VTGLLVALAAAVTVIIGTMGVRVIRGTDDFLLASRTISPGLNGAAVAGEYLSLASFLGIAGLILRNGVGVLWYAVGFATGFVTLLIWVAGPLRRSGAFTVGDFADARFGSPILRRIVGAVVLLISWVYLVPQLSGAGAVLRATSGLPYWAGVVIAGAIAAITVVVGGMRSATYVQAFLYTAKALFLAVPAVVLVILVGSALRAEALHPERGTQFAQATTVRFSADAELRTAEPVVVRIDSASVRWAAGPHRVSAGAAVTFPEGSAVPAVGGVPALGGSAWRSALLDRSGAGHPLFETWSLLVATGLGTMGLPHILLRFHTSPTGRSARRTAVVTVGLLGAFYLFPGIYGLLGRVAAPQLYLTGDTDEVVLATPGSLLGGNVGSVLTALVTAGAYAAFISVSAGLLLTLAAGASHDLRAGSVRGLRVTVVAAAASRCCWRCRPAAWTSACWSAGRSRWRPRP